MHGSPIKGVKKHKTKLTNKELDNIESIPSIEHELRGQINRQ